MPEDNQGYYRNAVDTLRQRNDERFGIASFRYHDEATNQDVWVRDATSAFLLDNFPAYNDVEIERNNCLLRCLARLRAIDYAITNCGYPKAREVSSVLRERFEALMQDDNPSEAAFNTFLIEQLHEANLTEGCYTVEQAEKLLSHYRNLSSVLDPAMPLVTLTYDKEDGVLQKEVQYPVTEKTPEQQKDISATLTAVEPYPLPHEKNAHTTLPIAMQSADAIFAGLIKRNDRMLPAQVRKTHAVGGVRNAYIVKVETVFDSGLTDIKSAVNRPMQALSDTKPFWFARMGMPVFVGKGESKERINHLTAKNLEQIRMAAQGHIGRDIDGVHLTVLNTNIPHEKQDQMIEGIRQAVAQRGSRDEFSNVAVNDIGTAFNSVELSQGMQDALKSKGSHPWLWGSPGQKANRLDIAVEVMQTASDSENKLSCVLCASGQDRTGTTVEKSIQVRTLERWKARYQEEHGQAPSIEEVRKAEARIQETRARGFNAAEVASHMVPGSPGMKRVSIANNLFNARRALGERAEAILYRASAETNTYNPVEYTVNTTLNTSSEYAKACFKEEMDALSNICAVREGDGPLLRDVKAAGLKLYNAFLEDKGEEFDEEEDEEDYSYAILQRFNAARNWVYKKVDDLGQAILGIYGIENPRDLEAMTAALRYAGESVYEFQCGNYERVQEHLAHIKLVRQDLPGHRKVSMQLVAVAIVATVALLLAVLVFSQPLSLLAFAGAGVVGSLLAMSAMAVMTVGARRTLEGAQTLFVQGREQAEAGAMRKFKAVVRKKVAESEAEDMPEASSKKDGESHDEEDDESKHTPKSPGSTTWGSHE